MKLKFKKQQFQIDAVNAVCDVFEGQGKDSEQYLFGRKKGGLTSFGAESKIFAWKNAELNSNIPFLENIKSIQKRNDILQSESLDGNGLNLTVEMETGTGKTFVYINSIYELNKRYGMTKFIVVVPSIAIREGVYKSFSMMEDYFKVLYGKKIRYFIFDSSKQSQIESFATNNGINVMIINNHAFNKKETNNMYKKTERGSALIDYINKTNPIIIIDEPQSVEGKSTKEAIKSFNPLFTLRYSATHRNIYNMVYRFDAVDAFREKKVKQINVKGIEIKGTTATHSYLYLEGIDISKNSYPKARIELEIKQVNGISKKSRTIKEGDDLFNEKFSNGLEQYKGYKVSEITSEYVKFTNGITLLHSEAHGNINEEHKRRIQIRETIRSHIRKEKKLFSKGIKVLSLFFIDEVKKYRDYDEDGNQLEGKYAQIFEEEYENIILETEFQDESYKKYLKSITSTETHEGYFSIDKKGKLVNPKEKGRGINKTCDDVSAYDLIMKNKELLLDLKNKVRFIFSHSALREGWDNPNVFQICVLRNTDPKEVRTRQEVGRGLRLCVNQNGERVDDDFEGLDFTQINVLTIIANDSYEEFANGLQKEFSKNIRERPSKLTVEFLTKRKIDGERISDTVAKAIHYDFVKNEYIDENDNLTDKYHEDRKSGEVKIRKELENKIDSIVEVIRELYEHVPPKADNEDDVVKITNKLNTSLYKNVEFRKLWDYINSKSTYTVDFDTTQLIENSVKEINENLHVTKILAETKTGEMKRTALQSDDFKKNTAFKNSSVHHDDLSEDISKSIKYDLIGKIVTETKITRKTVIKILSKIDASKFAQFKDSPEDFSLKVSKIINDEKAEIVNEKTVYHKTDETIPISIFEEIENGPYYPEPLERYLYDYLKYDSEIELNFAKKLDKYDKVLVFSKLPKNRYSIKTPVGSFSPDWVIVFDKEQVKYAYFVAETKGSSNKKDLRGVEKTKIDCAKKHFKAISDDNVKFNVFKDFEELVNQI